MILAFVDANHFLVPSVIVAFLSGMLVRDWYVTRQEKKFFKRIFCNQPQPPFLEHAAELYNEAQEIVELFPLKDRASISAYLGLLLEAPGFGYSPLKCVFTRFLAVSKVDCVADNGTIMGYREVDKALDIFLPYFKTTQGELYARRLVFFVIIAVLEYRREKSVLRSFEDLQGVLAYTW